MGKTNRKEDSVHPEFKNACYWDLRGSDAHKEYRPGVRRKVIVLGAESSENSHLEPLVVSNATGSSANPKAEKAECPSSRFSPE